jgi:hypothetical protein
MRGGSRICNDAARTGVGRLSFAPAIGSADAQSHWRGRLDRAKLRLEQAILPCPWSRPRDAPVLAAREEVTQVADLLGAPVAKALLGRAVHLGMRLRAHKPVSDEIDQAREGRQPAHDHADGDQLGGEIRPHHFCSPPVGQIRH